MNDVIKIIFCGDTALKTYVNNINPFSNMKKVFNDYDIIFMNLESVIAENIDVNTKLVKDVCLCEKPDKLQYIASLGHEKTIKIVNIANNHILDYGISAAEETAMNLKAFGINCIGIKNNNNIIVTVKDITICFLAFYNRYKIFEKNSDYVVDENEVIENIKNYRSKVDFIVVSAHWGTEHVLFANPTQQKLARCFVDYGADLVIGHHPHCIQGHEIYKNKNIYYSLGNFNFWGFDRPTMKMNQKGIAVSVSISTEIICKVLPIHINDLYVPDIERSMDTINKLNEISLYLIPKISIIGFFRRAAKIHLQGAFARRFGLVKRDKTGVFYFLAWLFAKPFNWGCYIALLLNLIGKDYSKLNEWE